MSYPGNEDPTQWQPPRDQPLGPPAHPSTPPQGYQVPPPGSAPPYPRTVPMPYPGPPAPPAWPGPPFQQHMVMVARPGPPTSGIAVASMVLGIIAVVGSCCTFGVPAVLAIIFGHLGMNETSGDRKGGRGMAVTGLVLGYVAVAPAVLLSIWFIIGGGMASMGVAGTPSTP